MVSDIAPNGRTRSYPGARNCLKTTFYRRKLIVVDSALVITLGMTWIKSFQSPSKSSEFAVIDFNSRPLVNSISMDPDDRKIVV